MINEIYFKVFEDKKELFIFDKEFYIELKKELKKRGYKFNTLKFGKGYRIFEV